VQEVFLSFYQAVGSKKILNVKGYLFQAAKFQCFMQLRAGKISQRHLDRMNQVIIGNVVEDDYNAVELSEILRQGIESLPEKCREVFYLSRFEFLSNSSIASQLNISPKTVENQIGKALKSLRASIQKFAAILLFLHF
jgi:RNA polymerase sigma factor (sigma-70 family)